MRVFDLCDGQEVVRWAAADDTISSVAFHPFLPLLATASGQRRYFLAPGSDSSGDDSSGSESEAEGAGSGAARRAAAAAPGAALSARENVLQVWRCGTCPLEAPPAEAAAEEAAAGDEAADHKAAAASVADAEMADAAEAL